MNDGYDKSNLRCRKSKAERLAAEGRLRWDMEHTPETRRKSNKALAFEYGLSRNSVGQIRREMIAAGTIPDDPVVYVTRDGKRIERKAGVRSKASSKAGKKSVKKAEPSIVASESEPMAMKAESTPLFSRGFYAAVGGVGVVAAAIWRIFC